MSVRMRLDARGRIVEAEACPSAIRSSARLSYDEVDAMLAGDAPAPTPEIGELIIERDRTDPGRVKVICGAVNKRSDRLDWDNITL